MRGYVCFMEPSGTTPVMSLRSAHQKNYFSGVLPGAEPLFWFGSIYF